MFPISLQRNFALRAFNSFGIAASAQAYLPVSSVDTLRAVRNDAQLAALPRLILGGGSNLLFTRDFPGLVLHMCNTGIELAGEDNDTTYVRAAAGENWQRLVAWTLQQGLGGLENLSLIPGSVGAAPIQNIGAYGVELKDRMHSLRAFDFASGEIVTLRNADCGFAYRDSVFKHALHAHMVVLDVTFGLPKHWQPQLAYGELAQALGQALPTPSAVSAAVCAIRSAKLPDPVVIGNAGSFFKNPLVTLVQRTALLQRFPMLPSYVQPDGGFKLAAAWLIDQCGWKGRQLGAAGVYAKQALVLVNHGGASGQEVLALARAIEHDVMVRFGVALEPEPVFI